MSQQLPSDGTPLEEAALTYASMGWQVFPVQVRGKLPLTDHGFKDATDDQVVILNWWGRWPAANIGIATGEPSGLVVLDVDLDKGGLGSFQRLVGALPRPTLLSLVQGTGGGGFHVLYGWPGHRVGNSAKGLRERFGPGLDIRGDGGYIVAAPSTHTSGRRYEWQTDGAGPLAPWPAQLDQLNAVEHQETASVAQLAHLDDARRARTDLEYYWRMVLRRRLDQLAEVTSNRNDALNEAAFRMGQIVALGAPETTIVEYLTEAGRVLSARGNHPMPDQELAKTIRSGLAAGRATPDRWFHGGRAS